jgi:ATP-dependent RNA helicase DeaD
VSFADLGVEERLAAALVAAGRAEPTPVQRQLIPVLLAGKSAVAVARTGSGKTLAYGVALLQRIAAWEAEEGAVNATARPRALVLTSTRELVAQAVRELKGLGHRPPVRVRGVAGGEPVATSIRTLRQPVDLLVGNPSRIRALVEQGSLNLSDVRILVVDEGDTLLMPGLAAEVDGVRAHLGRVQTAWVTATLPEPVRAMLLARPERPALLLVKDAHAPPPGIRVREVRVSSRDRADACADILGGAEKGGRGIVFLNRREGASEAAAALRERGHEVIEAHGGLPPDVRRRAMRRFLGGQGRVLVTTELAGRGLHVEGLAFVVNWELPPRASDWLHRAGRVGRQGTEGTVWNLVAPGEEGKAAELARLAKGGRLDTGEPLRKERERRRGGRRS